MKITLNGQTRELKDAPNLRAVVKQFCNDKIPVIAELNGKIIKSPRWETTILSEGDTVELVSFVGGG